MTRTFDYGTISDVILHLSYTAEFKQSLKDTREDEAQSVITLLKTQPLTRSFSLRHVFPDVFHRLSTSPLGAEIDFTIEARHFPFFLMGRTLKAHYATLRVISPLASVAGSTLAIGVKVVSPAKPVFRSMVASTPPLGEIHGVGLSAFELGDVLQSSTAPAGIAAMLLGNYVIKLTAAGPLAPNPPGNGTGAIDPSNLYDILLEIGYRLA